jgi:hypothetical protein
VPPAGPPAVALRFAPKSAVRIAVAIALFSAAMHYLVSGRKERDLNKMIAGAVLALASLFFL